MNRQTVPRAYLTFLRIMVACCIVWAIWISFYYLLGAIDPIRSLYMPRGATIASRLFPGSVVLWGGFLGFWLPSVWLTSDWPGRYWLRIIKIFLYIFLLIGMEIPFFLILFGSFPRRSEEGHFAFCLGSMLMAGTLGGVQRGLILLFRRKETDTRP